MRSLWKAQDATQELTGRLGGELGPRFSTAQGGGATPQAICQGLALGGLNLDARRWIWRDRWRLPRLRTSSRGETAMMCSVVVRTGLWLWGSGNVAANNAKRAEEENAKNVVLKKSDDEALKNEKTALTAEVSAVSKFLVNRVDWTDYLTQLSQRLPDGVKIVSIQGDYEMNTGSEKNDKKTKKGLVVVFSTVLAKGVAAPTRG